MEVEELYKLIGQITYSFTRIDFLISNIASDVGLVNTHQEFYAKRNFEKKLNNLKKKLQGMESGIEVIEQLKNSLIELEDLRNKRNDLVHSIILSHANENNEEYTFWNFVSTNKGIKNRIISYFDDDIRTLNSAFISLHNDIYMLWQELSNYSFRI